MKKYPVITLCGSTRFKDIFEKVQKELTLEGNIVISVGVFNCPENGEMLTENVKKMLDDIHLRKISMSDEIFVINKDGYIGDSTRNEIVYASKIGKKIRFLEEPSKEYLKMTFTWDDFHALPFETRKAIREFRKFGEDYSDDSSVWENLPDNGIEKKEFKKAVQLYDALLRYKNLL